VYKQSAGVSRTFATQIEYWSRLNAKLFAVSAASKAATTKSPDGTNVFVNSVKEILCVGLIFQTPQVEASPSALESKRFQIFQKVTKVRFIPAGAFVRPGVIVTLVGIALLLRIKFEVKFRVRMVRSNYPHINRVINIIPR
jgi:hypothetical protein